MSRFRKVPPPLWGKIFVALIVARSNLDEESACEALEIIRTGEPDGITY